MTTKVTVHPAGHPIEITMTQGGETIRQETTAPTAAAVDLYIYSGVSLTVREVTEAPPS